jgi:hypothetical protein
MTNVNSQFDLNTASQLTIGCAGLPAQSGIMTSNKRPNRMR